MSSKFVPYAHVADGQWQIRRNDGGTYNNEEVTHALLMDIRHQLKILNSLLHCSNFSSDSCEAGSDCWEHSEEKKKGSKATMKQNIKLTGMTPFERALYLSMAHERERHKRIDWLKLAGFIGAMIFCGAFWVTLAYLAGLIP